MNFMRFMGWVAATLLVAAGVGSSQAAETRPGLKSCRLMGLEHDAWCGVLQRPLDPGQPQGPQIDVHYAVVPALARNGKPDPVLFFAGGPGQSAIDLSGTVSRLLVRLAYRRDVVLVDQRGTGRSAPLPCAEQPPAAPLADSIDPGRQLARAQACLAQLQALPHGDLRHYTTSVAVQDADAVRVALGVGQVNLVGASYGTRAALEYMRQFPAAVRRAVLDGVAPPDMVLPLAMSSDNQAALDGVLAACKAEVACSQRWPTLAADWRALLASLPRQANVVHPLTGAVEKLTLTRDAVLAMVRGPLYAPALSSALPLAIHDAARGRFDALVGLSASLGGRTTGRLSEGMHYSVVCAEDLPRGAASADAPGTDFGQGTADNYQRICAFWPRGAVPAAFYQVGAAPAATLLLSGGADPVTPPRHGQRVTQALGAKARHVVVPQAGHGVMALACMRDVLFRFVDAPTDDAALQVDANCAQAIPRPGAFQPPGRELAP